MPLGVFDGGPRVYLDVLGGEGYVCRATNQGGTVALLAASGALTDASGLPKLTVSIPAHHALVASTPAAERCQPQEVSIVALVGRFP